MPLDNLSEEEIYEMLTRGQISVTDAIKRLQMLGSRHEPVRKQGAVEPVVPDLEDVVTELQSLIGLHKVKRLVEELHAYVLIQQRRKLQGLASEPLVLHMIFKGNPGTGKTTVARLLGQILYNLNVLSKGHLVEVERADLVGEYIGHTAQKTREQVRKAMGGILFIDEAYSLGRGGEKDFGKEAIDTLVKAMEDAKDQFIVILAGYKREMEAFLRLNPGLKSRFPIQVEFEDYTLDELTAIANLMLAKRDYRLSDDAAEKLRRLLLEQKSDLSDNFGNARLVRNIIERAMRRQAVRLIRECENTRDELMTIEAEDIALEGGETT